MKNEKVAKGRIIGLAGPCYLDSHQSDHLQFSPLLREKNTFIDTNLWNDD